MREILFRGKSLDKSGAWVEGSLIHRTEFYGDPCDDYFILYGGEFDCDYYDADRVDSKTVGQFIGLTDKNGKKIFEGDILEFRRGRTHIVKFEDGAFIFTDTAIPVRYADRFEVIGNIYDNPELLEVK